MGLSKEKIDQLLKDSVLRANQEFPDPPVCVRVVGDYGNEIFSTLGNFSTIIAPPKVGKTTAASIFIISLLRNEEYNYVSGSLPENKKKILWIDTEQGKYESIKILRGICKESTGDSADQPANLLYYNFRSYNNSVKLELTDSLINGSSDIGFVVIDGIRDFVSSINNEIEATQVAEKLLKWTETKNIHILTILHQNKGDGNARGHLGTELINKAETVARIERRDQDNTRITVIKPDLSRHKEFQEFAFTIVDDRIEKAEINEGYQPRNPKPNELTHYQLQDIVKITFETVKALPYGKLWPTLKKALKSIDVEFGDNKCKALVTYLVEKNYLILNEEKKHYFPAAGLAV